MGDEAHHQIELPRLATDIIDTVPGAALVIGGGPSAGRELPELFDSDFTPDVVIGANEHGYLQDFFPLTYSVFMDNVHNIEKRFMHEMLEDLDASVPTISKMPHASIRLPEWNVHCNSGLTAIAVAALTGASPIVVTGIDCYGMAGPDAGTYFHNPSGVSNSSRKSKENFDNQIRSLMKALQRAPIRPISGYLLERFKPYGTAVLPSEKRGPIADYIAKLATHYVQVSPARKSEKKFAFGGELHAGRIVAVSHAELPSIMSTNRCRELTKRQALDILAAQH